jgi:hypothetical protein
MIWPNEEKTDLRDKRIDPGGSNKNLPGIALNNFNRKEGKEWQI